MSTSGEHRRRARQKNVALALILLGLVALFYIVTLVKLGAI